LSEGLKIAAVVFIDEWQWREKPLSVYYDLMFFGGRSAQVVT
jgi:hypothetical protein